MSHFTSALPPDIDDLIISAIQLFWRSRQSGSTFQGGSRGQVIAGKNMDGFLHVVSAIVEHCGLPDTCVFTQGRGEVTLPGYYRPTKMWDALIVHNQRLLAAFEFKSQVGSFGNNINNRTEEALGSATNFQMASGQGLYSLHNHILYTDQGEVTITPDPRPPFVGYLMLLQDCEASTEPKRAGSKHFRLAPEFASTSYADRYRILCEKMMQHRLYDAAALILSEEEEGTEAETWRTLSHATDVLQLFASLAGRLVARAY